MKLPDASHNIFLKSKENFLALLEHYFPHFPEEGRERSLEIWKKDAGWGNFEMNQWEFIARLCRENEALLTQWSFSWVPAARMKFFIMCILFPEPQWDSLTSKSYRVTLREFRQLYLEQPQYFTFIEPAVLPANFYPASNQNFKSIVDYYLPQSSELRKEKIVQDLKEILLPDHFKGFTEIALAFEYHRKMKDGTSPGYKFYQNNRLNLYIEKLFKPDYRFK